MELPRGCPECRFLLNWGHMMAHNEAVVRKVLFCPRCRRIFHSEIVPGTMEVEEECYAVRFEWKGTEPTIAEILGVKLLDPDLQELPTPVVFAKLKKAPWWQTKGLSRFHFSQILQEARERGLTCQGVIVEPEGPEPISTLGL